MLSETTSTGVVGYTYNAASQQASMTAADRAPVVYSYDPAGRLQSITQGSETFTYGYDVLSRRASLERPNGVVTTYNYDEVNRLIRLLHQKSGNAPIEDLQYTYNLDDEIESIASLASAPLMPTAKSASVADGANRITQFGNAQFVFDLEGQTTSKTATIGSTAPTDDRGRMTGDEMSSAGDVRSTAFRRKLASLMSSDSSHRA